MFKIGVIYKLTSPKGKCYVGQSWNYKHRWVCYKNLYVKGQVKLERALKKYGPENFKYEIIDKTDNQETLDQKEIHYIKFFDCIKNGYNCKKTKDKISKIKRGKRLGPHTQEHKKKISEGLEKFYLQTEWRPNNWKGKKHTEKTKELMSFSKSKLWIVTSSLGESFVIYNLKKFCNEKKIHYSNLCQVAKGNRKTSHGWKCRRYS